MGLALALLLLSLASISAVLPAFFRQKVLPILTLPLLAGPCISAFAIEDTMIGDAVPVVNVIDSRESEDQSGEELRRVAKKVLLQQKASEDDSYVNKLKKEQLKQESRKKSKVQRSKDLCETLGTIFITNKCIFCSLTLLKILIY